MQLEDEGQRKRWSLSRLLGRSKAEQGPRIVTHAAGAAPPHTLLHPLGGPQRRYRGNRTSTTKYTLLTFLPKSLFEQYRRVANIYFTINAALSLTPYSPVRPWTTFLPLGLVLGIAMMKEAIEDYKRYRQDVEVNNRNVEVFDPVDKKFVIKTWADVRVGDIITVFKDEFFPADLLFLSAENEDGLCYIETMQLDGETNLKIKKALDETKHLTRSNLAVLGFSATVQCEPPNSRLYHFTGNLELPDPHSADPIVVPVPPAALLLRGCSLRNTHRIYGMVLYAGHDTKIFMNSTQPPSKRSRVERTVDRIILFMFSLLFAMCLVGCIYFAFWTTRTMPAHWYLAPDQVPKEYDPSNPVVVGVTNFITAFILYSYLIPISLYVSIEMVKVVQAFVFIGRDRDMYHAETDTPAVARTSNLNEELGMVNTVLTDKTGTLTRNVMEFFKASIGGTSYGAGITEIERANAARRGIPLADDEEAGGGGSGSTGVNGGGGPFLNGQGGSGKAAGSGVSAKGSSYREQYFNFYDERIMAGRWAEQPNPHLAREFFRMLALCHTVIPDGPPDPKVIRYEAESPDEAALVVAAKVFGFFFFKRTNTTLRVREALPEGEQEVEYEVLNILEFNSTRKRMSVVLRCPDGRLVLYCKGADTVIYERMARGHPTNEALRDVTLQHMEDYGSAGLRTLCLAYKELDPAFYDLWQERYIEAKTSMDDRQTKVDKVSEDIERDLVLLGCTAIEDKLQEGVPQAIKAMAEANIRLWVLTGDKMETAINIGYACSLITDEMTQFQVTGHSPEVEALEAQGLMEEALLLAGSHVRSELERVSRTLEEDAAAKLLVKYALVIDGKALLYALSPMLRDLFLEVSLKCAAVVCCRVSPLQKAQVTALVKSRGDVTLAIGDGANDVGMIQKAHIGVGISGQEGMQAVMAADFAIAQFRFLTPLLLVHGRLSYKRITRMILFFFYKNLLFGTTIFVYNAFAAFSGQPIYNDFYMTMFNVVFTACAPLVVGWFDRDLDKGYGLRFPLLYKDGQRNLYFNLRAISGWLATAILHAVIILAAVMWGAHSTEVDRHGGHTLGLAQDGILMFSIVILTVHAHLGTAIDQWTWMHHAACWGSIALWFLFLLAYGALPITFSSDLHRIFSGTIAGAPFFWLTCLIVPGMCVLPVFVVRSLQRYLRPQYYQVVQEVAARERAGEVLYEGAPCAGSGLHGARSGPQLAAMLAKAGRLMQRRTAKAISAGSGGGSAGGAGGLRRGVARYSGFVAPYEARSRVFDSNELRANAAVAGYEISMSGDTMSAAALPLGLRGGTLSATAGSATGGGGLGPGSSVAAPPAPPSAGSGAEPLGTPTLSAAPSSTGALPGTPPAGARASAALVRALGGMHPGHRRTASAGAVLAGGLGSLQLMPFGPLGGASASGSGGGGLPAGAAGNGGGAASASGGGASASGVCAHPITRASLGGTSAHSDSLAPQGSSAWEEAVYAGNPVLAQLDLEFSRDPRRHRNAGRSTMMDMPSLLVPGPLPRVRSSSLPPESPRGGGVRSPQPGGPAEGGSGSPVPSRGAPTPSSSGPPADRASSSSGPKAPLGSLPPRVVQQRQEQQQQQEHLDPASPRRAAGSSLRPPDASGGPGGLRGGAPSASEAAAASSHAEDPALLQLYASALSPQRSRRGGGGGSTGGGSGGGGGGAGGGAP